MKKAMSSGARMRANGYTPSQVWLTAEQEQILRAAADAEGIPLTQVLIHGGMERAKRILRKSEKRD